MLKNFVKLWSSTILLFCLTLLPVTFCAAKEGVSGRYASASGKQIVLALNLNTAGPINLIVDQNVGHGTVITATSPSAQKINPNSGQVKWLFRNVNPGSLNLVITLKNPIKGRPQALVKYRLKGSGGFEELRISP